MNTPRILFLLAAASVVAMASGDASAKLAKAGDATVSFTATGPAGLKIVGTTGELSVVDDGQTVTVTVPVLPTEKLEYAST